MEDEDLVFKLNRVLGYMQAYAPEHELANGAGIIYEHRFRMIRYLGRDLYPDEVVHHKDRNKANNSLDNLQLMTSSEHTRLHMIEDKGIIFENRMCECGNIFEVTHTSDRKYCSPRCAKKFRRKFEINSKDLEELVWSRPMVEVAKLLGVSDRAIGKRCKLLGVKRPPRGYWAKAENKA
jgi:hypothetical protein